MKKRKESKEQQLQFGLKDTPKNIYYKYKDQYEVWLAGLETRKYVKDPLTWFTLVISLTFVITEISILESNTKIPSKIPLFNYFIAPSERLVIKDLAYLFPALSSSSLWYLYTYLIFTTTRKEIFLRRYSLPC